MIKLSANLGFLWADLALPDAIRAAKAADFDAVECHWPYATPAVEVAAALEETGLKMLSLNTSRGNVEKGENGLAAVLGREQQAQHIIDEAISYAADINCQHIHVMAGVTDKNRDEQKLFASNLRYACQAAAANDQTILIEPLNQYDAPGYHISTMQQALATINMVGEPNLKIMFDCYHMQIVGGDLLRRFKNGVEHIAHVQFAGVPDRGEPDNGEVNYPWLLHEFVAAGYDGYFGAEYKPHAATEAGLDWMATLKEESPQNPQFLNPALE